MITRYFLTVFSVLLLVGCGGSDQGSSGSGADNQDLAVNNNYAPIARITNYGLGKVGSTYTLYGDTSSDADGDPLIATWELVTKPTNSVAILAPITALNVSFSPDLAGEYQVKLTVDDGQETNSKTVLFTAATPIGGTMSGDNSLTSIYSPYILTGDVDIPSDSSLTLEPNTTLYTSQVLRSYAGKSVSLYAQINVYGSLFISGVDGSPVTIFDSRIRGSNAKIEINYGDLTFHHVNTGNLILAGVDVISNSGGTTTISDSSFNGVIVLDIYSPASASYLERNTFNSSVDVYAATGYQSSPIYINNNLFNRNILYAYSSMEQFVFVSGNTFIPNGGYSLYMDSGSTTTSGTFLATDNYWSSQDSSAIRSTIYDGYINGGFTDYVQFEPFLTQAHIDAPIP